MKYKLIHIDTLEVTMCEKITIDGNDYFVSDKQDKFTNKFWSINLSSKYTHKEITEIENQNEFESYFLQKECNVLIATTNTLLQCPQVVDYVEELAESNYGTDIDSYRSSKPFDLEADRKQGFVKGYQKHYETHSLSDEESCLFAEYSVKNILYNDENGILIVRTYNELLTQFKSTLPAKIYYR